MFGLRSQAKILKGYTLGWLNGRAEFSLALSHAAPKFFLPLRAALP